MTSGVTVKPGQTTPGRQPWLECLIGQSFEAEFRRPGLGVIPHYLDLSVAEAELTSDRGTGNPDPAGPDNNGPVRAS
jgi:hypothetical protein